MQEFEFQMLLHLERFHCSQVIVEVWKEACNVLLTTEDIQVTNFKWLPSSVTLNYVG